ncbi:RagB/SusD family nutrient uptake outer membrane protein [Butyricimonas sp.]|uniref:RagB/SusD family nutrient uptake outer membrane protein n=1 Tax=Butyricimonas sp. TaxID=1969738 RepID=UPI0025B7EF85|nr:RagB/SusD family nutrient uptake outer membrane protein [Butyricimonas sp.]
MKKYNIYIIAFLTFICFSCKEYLDVKPKGKILPKTAEEFRAMLELHLNRVEGAMENYILGDAKSILDYEMYSDNLDAKLTFYPQGGALKTYVGDGLNDISDGYEYLYGYIRDCNIVIDNLNDGNETLEKNVLGTAYCLRSVCYYNLLRTFCEPYDKSRENELLGLPLVESFDMEERPLRSSWTKTFEFIEKDLLAAIDYNVKDEVWIFTSDVAKAYLAKLYFWAQKWDKVIPLAQELLEKYPLLAGQAYVDMIQSKNEKKGNVLIRSYTVGGMGVSDMTYGFAIEDRKYRPVSKELVELFTDGKQDIRYELSFNKQRLAQKNVCANVRSAEMCLMLAESYLHQEDESHALEYLNLLRSKRIENYVAYTKDNLPEIGDNDLIQVNATGKTLSKLMRVILSERRKELFMEGDRWFELKRNGRPEFWGTAEGKKYITSKYLYTAPLPKKDIELLPDLIQNEGYED